MNDESRISEHQGKGNDPFTAEFEDQKDKRSLSDFKEMMDNGTRETFLDEYVVNGI